ncbi:hypothetical protein B0A58_11385 [Flavobacterium branchiophilum NBRC 15030 = ATCC 35035]|uniref:Uncharacterized protein n=1 Tax=Flavobacterium branchiophilum TaxID=55197 RepID=A0A543FZM8_9FLAO|nr:hypothetical protein [Flavobacterium branchiophilum]OXA73980.1 hypothetical protein B0A58_11385 [Flavobacterium branchiophilum NBRC 15030 = ATCC 35035]TQM39289.1 hypothetical protein BC670_0067 [Flavobacterium branchiophilum]GEM54984.1 hypothetical protein FB1_12050 [Flavobacterium branchiophilum NBRC 15030 = ATCC 35035]
MRKIFAVVFILVCGSALAQTKKDTLELLNFEFRWYNTSPCGCYIFPKNDSIYTKKDTIKQQLILFKNRTKLFKKKKPLG